MCPGGWGVMMDDVLAGSYALVIVYVLKLIIF
ncbi:phosphatidylglycerophosphatase A [uncultured Muribaculum sp.]